MNSHRSARATGSLAVSLNPDLVSVLGDQQYPVGSLAQYLHGYDTTAWGNLKARTRPVPGNHEYGTPGAAGYFAYFGQSHPYYAFAVGCGWRGYALNSEVNIATEARWLRIDLTAHPGKEVLVYWHRPRYSSGIKHGSDPAMQPFWTALAGRSGIVLNGHEHNYERFAARGGLRAFVVGTGGSSSYPFRARPVPGSVKRIAGTPGVLVLHIKTGSYTWSFRNTNNRVLDAGAARASSGAVPCRQCTRRQGSRSTN